MNTALCLILIQKKVKGAVISNYQICICAVPQFVAKYLQNSQLHRPCLWSELISTTLAYKYLSNAANRQNQILPHY